MKTFEGFGLSGALNQSLARMDYTTPTPIQQQAIPLALAGKDVLGSAQTGTGKTAAFSIPLVEALLRAPKGNALVLTPTRELAKQVLGVIHDLLGYDSPIKTAFIIGGEPYHKQNKQLQANPRIIVGTPGRINDHLERGTVNLRHTGFLVLDETDRMLDMGFGVQLDRIAAHLPAERQTLMFSATLPKGIIKISEKYLSDPARVSVGETNVIAKNIQQDVIRIEQPDKYKALTLQLDEREGSVIVFVKTKYNADKMAKKLRQDGFTSEGLHGNLRQNKRDKVMKNFRERNFRVLVATDIAARGLDVPHIEHVINYDLPQVAEDYIHRMGRTARAGAVGSALSFVASQDSRKWHAIECLLNPEAAKSRKPMPPQGKNKSRRKPYRGRPEKPRAEGAAENHAFVKDRKPKAGKPHKKAEGNFAKSGKPKAERSFKKAEGEGGFNKDRKPKGKNNKPYGKKQGQKPGGSKANGGGMAPMKRRNRNKKAA